MDTSVTRKDQSCLPLISTQAVSQTGDTLFYNERFEKNYLVGYETGSVFTKLCEVTVTGTVTVFMNVSSNSPLTFSL